MDLWIATGGGMPDLANLERRAPLLEPSDVVSIGYRDHAERLRTGAADPADLVLRAYPFELVRALSALESRPKC